ncbi:MAG: AAA family ATPase [Rhodospirillales bacterium]|nr:AAA family ATPase [Rhodospirillales bacterium]
MTTDYERRLIVSYLANAAKRLHHRDRAAQALAEWVIDREDGAGFVSRRLRSRLERADIDPDERPSGGDWRSFRRALRDECAATGQERPDLTASRLQRLAETTGLNRTDIAILELLLRYHTQPIIESMIDEVLLRSTMFERLASRTLKGSVVPALLGVSAGTVRDRLSDGVPLVSSGLVSVERDGDVTIVDRLRRLATVPASAGLDASRLLLDPAPRSELEWSDFDHIAEGRDHIERLIQGALRTSAPGVNILLYGPPGTGKTEFCKVLAERLDVTLYGVGEADDDGDEPSRGERLQELRLAQRLLARDGRSLLLFDEMEDLLSEGHSGLSLFGQPFFSGSRNGGSKVYMHRLLERAPAPTLWAMNDARSVSQTLLRRMMFALELRPPTAAVRARIWSRQLEHHGIEAGPDEAHALAREFAATPGVAAGATAAARIGGGGIETVRHGVRGLSRVLSCDAPPQGTPPLFDPALIQADTDPVALADSLVASGERHFSLCLQGPPGTGKSAFVRYLAEQIRLEVMQKRASDLMSMWVGETERNIAAAFAEARDTGAFLVFDEADSLLADRRGAERSWEVSQVNEMLTWMESHPLPFACTTNYGEHLDTATLRRFVFKVTLDYLSPEQAGAAFRTYFGLMPPAETATLTALTPGDFAVVRRKAALLGKLEEPEALAAMLGAECAAKPDRPRPVGFRA